MTSQRPHDDPRAPRRPQFVRATINHAFQASDGKAAEAPPEVSTAVLLVDALCKV